MPLTLKKRKTASKIIAGLLTAVVSWTFSAGEASAHASLIASSPAYGSTTNVAPTTVKLQFDNMVEPGLVKVRLKNADTDTEVDKATLIGERTPRAEVEFSLPEHGTGKFLITWVSFAFDGHIVSGTIPYTVDPNWQPGAETDTSTSSEGGDDNGGEVVPTGQEESGSTNKIIDIVEIQFRFLSYLAIAALFGGLVWLYALRNNKTGVGSGSTENILEESSGASTNEETIDGEKVSQNITSASNYISDLAKKALMVGAFLASAMAILRLFVGFWRFQDGGYEIGETLNRLIDGQIGGYVVAAILFAIAGVINSKNLIATVTASSFATIILAGLGHAASYAVPGLGSILMGGHFVAASIWVGSVVLFAYIATEKKFSGIEWRWTELNKPFKTLGSIYIACVATLGVTGMHAVYTYNDGMPEGRWGVTLYAKLALVAGGGVIGLFHHLRARRGRALSGSTLAVEAGLLVLTLTAASVLSVTII